MTEHTSATSRLISIAGAFLVLAGCIALMGIISAETFYPGYSTAQNDISDLGATRPPDSIIIQPSATIFNATMLATGLLVIGATLALFRAGYFRTVMVPLGLFGLGAFLVGVFPGNWGNIHALSALLTFVAGALSAIAAATVVRSPLREILAALGAISLLTLGSYFVMGSASPMAILGSGGLERWIAYPVVLFVLAFGGYLVGDAREAAVS
ncbi:MAG: DUF998 domain-containing protein [Methanoregulaceae archaeon]